MGNKNENHEVLKSFLGELEKEKKQLETIRLAMTEGLKQSNKIYEDNHSYIKKQAIQYDATVVRHEKLTLYENKALMEEWWNNIDKLENLNTKIKNLSKTQEKIKDSYIKNAKSLLLLRTKQKETNYLDTDQSNNDINKLGRAIDKNRKLFLNIHAEQIPILTREFKTIQDSVKSLTREVQPTPPPLPPHLQQKQKFTNKGPLPLTPPEKAKKQKQVTPQKPLPPTPVQTKPTQKSKKDEKSAHKNMLSTYKNKPLPTPPDRSVKEKVKPPKK